MITITQQPPVTNLAVGPNIWTLSGLTTQDRYVLTLEVGATVNGDTITPGVQVATFKQTPNPSGVGIFSIGEILQSYLGDNTLTYAIETTEPFGPTPGAALLYRIRYGVETGDIITYTGFSKYRVALNGYKEQWEAGWLDANDFIPLLTQCLTDPFGPIGFTPDAPVYFLRDPGTLRNGVQIKRVDPQDWGTLHWINYGRPIFDQEPFVFPQIPNLDKSPAYAKFEFYSDQWNTLISEVILPIDATTGFPQRPTVSTNQWNIQSPLLVGTVASGPRNLKETGIWPVPDPQTYRVSLWSRGCPTIPVPTPTPSPTPPPTPSPFDPKLLTIGLPLTEGGDVLQGITLSGEADWTAAGPELPGKVTVDPEGNFFAVGGSTLVGTIFKYNPDGARITTATTPGGGNVTAIGTSDGFYYVGSDANTISKVINDDNHITSWTVNTSRPPISITVDKSGNVYAVILNAGVGELTPNALVKLDSNGNEIWSKAVPGGGSLALSPDDQVIYFGGDSAGGQVPSLIAFNPDGEGLWGDSNIDRIEDLAVDTTGNIWAVGILSQSGITGAMFGPAGNIITTINHGVTLFGVTVDKDGNAYTAGDRSELSGFTTVKYDQSGTPIWGLDRGARVTGITISN